MAENEVEVVFRMKADATDADEIIQKFGGDADKALASLQLSAKGLTDRISNLNKQIEKLATEKMPESVFEPYRRQLIDVQVELNKTRDNIKTLKTAMKEVGETTEESSKKSVTAIGQVKSQLGDVISLRRILMSTVGLVSVGFMISEWQNVAQQIKDAALALGGFDANLKQIQADVVEDSRKALTGIRAISDEERRQLETIKDKIKFQEALRENEIKRIKEAQAGTVQQQIRDADNLLIMQARDALQHRSIDEAKEILSHLRDQATLQEQMAIDEKSHNVNVGMLVPLYERQKLALDQIAKIRGITELKEDGIAKRLKEDNDLLKEYAAKLNEADLQHYASTLRDEAAEDRIEAKKKKQLATDEAYTLAALERFIKEDAARDKVLLAEHERVVKMIVEIKAKQAGLAIKEAHDQEIAVKRLNVELRHWGANLSALGPSIEKPLPALNQLNLTIKSLTVNNKELSRALTEADAIREQSAASQTAYFSKNAADLFKTIGLRREYAAFMAIYETAEGFKALGDSDFWAAAQDFASAAMYAKAAGSGDRKHEAAGRGREGGGGGREDRTSGRGKRDRDGVPIDEASGGGGASGGGEGAASVTTLQIKGNLSSLGQQQLAAWVGMGSATGLFKFTSSGSSGIAAPRY